MADVVVAGILLGCLLTRLFVVFVVGYNYNNIYSNNGHDCCSF